MEPESEEVRHGDLVELETKNYGIMVRPMEVSRSFS